MDPLTEVTVLRVVQECLTNIQKHSEASEVEVSLHVTHADLKASVRDNGRGFDPRSIGSGEIAKGLGLVSMQERAELLGGSLSVRSSPGSGCEIVLCIPSREVEDGDN